METTCLTIFTFGIHDAGAICATDAYDSRVDVHECPKAGNLFQNLQQLTKHTEFLRTSTPTTNTTELEKRMRSPRTAHDNSRH